MLHVAQLKASYKAAYCCFMLAVQSIQEAEVIPGQQASLPPNKKMKLLSLTPAEQQRVKQIQQRDNTVVRVAVSCGGCCNAMSSLQASAECKRSFL